MTFQGAGERTRLTGNYTRALGVSARIGPDDRAVNEVSAILA